MHNERAVSEILGYSLVFTLVVLSVAIVSVGGLSAYQDAENFERETNAQKAYDVLHNNLEDIYYQSAPSRGTEIDLGDTSLAMGDRVTINVTVEENGGSREVFIIRPQPLVQDLGEGDRLVYEGGAVFQTTRDGGILQQAPPMVLREDTANIIVPNVTQPNDRSVGSGTVLIRARGPSRTLLYDNTTRDPQVDNLIINITSPRAPLWEEHLSERGAFAGTNDCRLEADDTRVICESNSIEQVYLTRIPVQMFFDR
jgi:hypothetical protein